MFGQLLRVQYRWPRAPDSGRELHAILRYQAPTHVAHSASEVDHRWHLVKVEPTR